MLSSRIINYITIISTSNTIIKRNTKLIKKRSKYINIFPIICIYINDGYCFCSAISPYTSILRRRSYEVYHRLEVISCHPLPCTVNFPGFYFFKRNIIICCFYIFINLCIIGICYILIELHDSFCIVCKRFLIVVYPLLLFYKEFFPAFNNIYSNCKLWIM